MATNENYSVDDMYSILTDCVNPEAVDLVVAINGYSRETMVDILYATTGLRDFDDLYR